MSVIESSQPFALTYLNQIDGANGLGITEALTEFIDNAEDANSPCFLNASATDMKPKIVAQHVSITITLIINRINRETRAE